MKNKDYPYYPTPKLNNLQELLCYCAESYKEKTVFHYLKNGSEVRINYQKFFEDVAALCCYFVKCGYNRTHIAVLGENSYEWLISFFAIVNSNNVVVPLDKELSAEDLSDIISRSDSTVLIYSDAYTEEAIVNKNKILINMNTFSQIITEYKTDKCEYTSFYDDITLNNEALSAIFYTSGTTAKPKGVMLSHSNIALDAVFTNMNATVPDSSMLVLPLYHTYAIIMAIALPMINGASIFINKNMRTLMSDMLYCKPKYMAIVPLMMEIFYKKIKENLKKSGKDKTIDKLLKISKNLNKFGIDLRKVFFSKIIDSFGGRLELLAIGGAPINKHTVEGLTNFGIQAIGGYGTTECSPIVSSVRNKHFKPDSVGYVIPNVQVRIVNDEIQIKGDIVFSGYYKDREATEAAFDGDWYKTGDLGSIEDGFLYINGRCKNMIVLSNGENISPESIEVLLQEKIPEIDEVIVFGENDIIAAEIYISSDISASSEKIQQDIDILNKSLPKSKQITKVIFRDTEFDKTTTKKIKRNIK